MATTAITPVALAAETLSTDLAAIGTVPTVAADGWTISNPRGADEMLVFLYDGGGGADTVTFAAGDRPPAQEKDRGALAVTLTASKVHVVRLNTARHMKSGGTIVATCTSTSTKLYAMLLSPRGH